MHDAVAGVSRMRRSQTFACSGILMPGGKHGAQVIAEKRGAFFPSPAAWGGVGEEAAGLGEGAGGGGPSEKGGRGLRLSVARFLLEAPPAFGAEIDRLGDHDLGLRFLRRTRAARAYGDQVLDLMPQESDLLKQPL